MKGFVWLLAITFTTPIMSFVQRPFSVSHLKAGIYFQSMSDGQEIKSLQDATSNNSSGHFEQYISQKFKEKFDVEKLEVLRPSLSRFIYKLALFCSNDYGEGLRSNMRTIGAYMECLIQFNAELKTRSKKTLFANLPESLDSFIFEEIDRLELSGSQFLSKYHHLDPLGVSKENIELAISFNPQTIPNYIQGRVFHLLSKKSLGDSDYMLNNVQRKLASEPQENVHMIKPLSNH